MNIAILVLVSLDLAATATVAVIALKVVKGLQSEVDDMKLRTNEALTNVQSAVGAMKF